MSEDKKENLIKQVCKELGLTYAQLGEKIGVKKDSLTTIASSGKISQQLEKSLEMLLIIEEQKKKLKDYENLQKLLQNIVLNK